MMLSIISSGEISVTSHSTSGPANRQSEFKSIISFKNKNETWTVNSSYVRGDKIPTRSLAKLYDVMPIANKMGRKGK